MKSIITGLALAALCFAVPQFLGAQDQSGSSGQSSTESSAQAPQPTGMDPGTHHPMRSETPTDINKASRLIGMDVRNNQNEKLGVIRDIIVDLPSHQVGYTIMEKQKELAKTGKYVAVPLSVFTPSSDLKHLIINVEKDKIDTAKGFAKGELPAMPLSSSDMSFWRSISEAAGATHQ